MDPVATQLANEAAGWRLFGVVFFIIPWMLFLSAVSACIAVSMRKYADRNVQIFLAVGLMSGSFGVFLMQGGDFGLINVLILIAACLWFPAAVILAFLVVPGTLSLKNYPLWIFLTTAGVFMLEEVFDMFIAGLLGLRFVHSLILIPPPALPYEFLRIPEIDKVFIQCFTTFLIAALFVWIGMALYRIVSGPVSNKSKRPGL
jgi:hypothetical protein